MMKRLFFAAAILGACLPLSGCGDESGTTDVYVEDEMAKYRSTPEQIAAGMASSAAKPTAKDLNAKVKEAKEVAKSLPTENKPAEAPE